jgi:hypothetical protein
MMISFHHHFCWQASGKQSTKKEGAELASWLNVVVVASDDGGPSEKYNYHGNYKMW